MTRRLATICLATMFLIGIISSSALSQEERSLKGISALSVAVELRAEEAQVGEWPEAVVQALDEISQTDSVTGRTSITLNVRCAWSAAEGCFEPGWAFLNAARHVPRASSRTLPQSVSVRHAVIQAQSQR